jgi:hypothetical protein
VVGSCCRLHPRVGRVQNRTFSTEFDSISQSWRIQSWRIQLVASKTFTELEAQTKTCFSEKWKAPIKLPQPIFPGNFNHQSTNKSKVSILSIRYICSKYSPTNAPSSFNLPLQSNSQNERAFTPIKSHA